MKRDITEEQKALAKSNGISQSVLYNRINTRGWDAERACTEKPLNAAEIGERARDLRVSERSNSWFSDGNTLIKCPVEGCNHTGDVITKAHLRIEHGLTQKEAKKKYGMPIKQFYKKGGRQYAATINPI